MTSPLEAHDQHTVLLVDDEKPILVTLQALLERDGHRVLVARSGAEGLEIASASLPCLVLADVTMPGMDGFELCRRLEAQERTSNIPVALVTGRVSDEDVARGIRAGAVDYIKKPFDGAEVRMRVGTQIRLHESLRRAEMLQKKLDVISRSANDAILLMNSDGEIVHWNEAAELMFGYSKAEALGMNLNGLLAPVRFRESHGQAFLRFKETGAGDLVGKMTEIQALRKGGEEFPIELSLSSALLEGSWHAVGIIRDITLRRRDEERHRVLWERSPHAIMTLAPPSWSFTSANPAAIELFAARDAEQLLSLSILDVSCEKQLDGRWSREAVRKIISRAWTESSCSFEWAHKDLADREFPAMVHLTKVELAGESLLQATVRDISQQKTLEAELSHARKLEAVGQLAAGIAHEINTPTQFVGDSIHFLKEAYDDLWDLTALYRHTLVALEGAAGYEQALEEVREAEEAADLEYLEEHVPGSFDRCFDGLSRIATIVGSMKEFAHPDQREKSPADLNQALRATLTIAKNEYKYVARVTTELGELPPVLCHIGDLNQVFLNMIVNAAHAISDGVAESGEMGRIEIRTSAVNADLVRIEIADTGCGIPPAVRDRIYEPFFTTKEVGRGSGQGLAIARSIVVDKHNGSLSCESEEGRGTTFVISLPVDEKSGDSGGARS